MMNNLNENRNALFRWEIALAVAVGAAILQTALFPESVTPGWWSVMFPGLAAGTEPPGWQEAARLDAAGQGLELRLWIVDFLRGLFG